MKIAVQQNVHARQDCFEARDPAEAAGRRENRNTTLALCMIDEPANIRRFLLGYRAAEARPRHEPLIAERGIEVCDPAPVFDEFQIF